MAIKETYPRTIIVRVTEKQYQKIVAKNKPISDVIRKLIDKL